MFNKLSINEKITKHRKYMSSCGDITSDKMQKVNLLLRLEIQLNINQTGLKPSKSFDIYQLYDLKNYFICIDMIIRIYQDIQHIPLFSSTHLLTIITREVGELKTKSSIYFIKCNYQNWRTLRHALYQVHISEKHFVYSMPSDKPA